jgi:hypothetical protein
MSLATRGMKNGSFVWSPTRHPPPTTTTEATTTTTTTTTTIVLSLAAAREVGREIGLAPSVEAHGKKLSPRSGRDQNVT